MEEKSSDLIVHLLIYLSQDIVTGDEIISDTYNLKEIDDVVYEVDCRKVTKGADNIDIGANPSAEEQEEALDEGTKQVIDVVDGFRLNFLGDEASGTRAFATKKDFQGQFKGVLGFRLLLSMGFTDVVLMARVPQEGCGKAEGSW